MSNHTSHVFISFKSEERDIAKNLKEALEAMNFKVWWSEEIQCGQEWHGAIDKAIAEAGAVIVLWSQKAMKSQWIRHEASQAIAQGVYTPVRVELIEVETPYNRVQAADLIRWNGELTYPGFQHLLARLTDLMPAPISIWKRAALFLWQQRAAFVFFIIILIALILLFKQGRVLDNQSIVLGEQIQKQDEIVQNVRSTENLLNKTKDSLNTQFGNLSKLNNQIGNQLLDNALKSQKQFDQTFKSQKEITSLATNTNLATTLTLNDLNLTRANLSQLEERLSESYKAIARLNAQTDTNLQSIRQTFNEIKSVSAPLTPVEIIFKIKIKIEQFIPSQNMTLNNKWIRIGSNEICNITTTGCQRGEGQSEWLLWEKIRKDVDKNFYLSFEFYSDSTYSSKRLAFSYVSSFLSDGDEEVRTYEKFDREDTSLTRFITLRLTDFDENPENVTNIYQLLNDTYLQVTYQHEFFSENEYILSNPKTGVKKRVRFTEFYLEPYFEIHYGKDFLQSRKISKNVPVEKRIDPGSRNGKKLLEFFSLLEMKL